MAAEHIYGSVTATKTMGKTEPVTFCVANHVNFEKLLRFILLVKHMRVEIFKFSAPKVEFYNQPVVKILRYECVEFEMQ